MTKPKQPKTPIIPDDLSENDDNLPIYHEDRVKKRRLDVMKLWIEGYSVAETAKKLDYGTATITRDLTEIKKERGKMLEKLIKDFNINEYVSKRLRSLERRRAVLWAIIEDETSKPMEKVNASKALAEFEEEEENLFIRAGIKTMEGKPEDLVNKGVRIAVYSGSPPAGYKMPQGWKPDNPPDINKPKINERPNPLAKTQ